MFHAHPHLPGPTQRGVVLPSAFSRSRFTIPYLKGVTRTGDESWEFVRHHPDGEERPPFTEVRSSVSFPGQGSGPAPTDVTSPPGPSAGTSMFGPPRSKGPQPTARAPGFHPLSYPRSPPSPLPATELPLQTLASGAVLAPGTWRNQSVLFYSAGPPARSPPPRCEHAAAHGMALFACNSPEHRRSPPSSQCHSLH